MSAVGQDKMFSLEDLIPGGKTYSQFTSKTDYSVKWRGDDLIFFDEKEIYRVNPEKPEQKELLFSKEDWSVWTKKADIKPKQLSFILSGNQWYASLPDGANEKVYYFDWETRTEAFSIPMLKKWENTDFCIESRKLAFTMENKLFVTDDKGNPVVVAEDNRSGIVYGQAAHRNEFGINKGTFWSPRGNFLAFYRMDETQVGDYPLVDISAPEARLKMIKYPMAGASSQEVTLGIYNIHSKKIIYLNTGEPADHYLTNVSWDPNEKFIYIAELNREQNHLQLNKYDIETGQKVLCLFEEHNDKYVEPEHPLLFLKKSPDRFIWQSKRDGFNHLYLYNTEGKLLKQLTSGNYEITSVTGWDEDEKNIFFVSNELNPVELQVYKLNLKTGSKTRLSLEAGVHTPTLSASGKYLLDKYSNQTTPLNIDLISTNKVRSVRLQTAKNPYDGYVLPEIHLGSLKADDGKTDLYYRLVKPASFDSSKKYPVIIYVYGGPHSQMVKNAWLGAIRGWDIYMAQKGYLVFTLDNRGTSNRGSEFENVIHRHLGINETADQMKGVEWLRSLPYVDSDRIGVYGWSYGGFMTANLMLRHPETFKVGVAGGPVIDWKYYEVMYGERYMDSPQENPEGYEETNMNGLAGNLQGRFLLIHGNEDPTVVWQNSLSFLKACIKAGTYPDYFVYPGQGHNMAGRDRIHLHEKITWYFEDFL
jgi:dipeptidyl-peptidase-4